jgi:hypothetical protein
LLAALYSYNSIYSNAFLQALLIFIAFAFLQALLAFLAYIVFAFLQAFSFAL